MQLSQLIAHLQKLLDQEGDMPVMCPSMAKSNGLVNVGHLIHWRNPVHGCPYAEIS